MAPPHGVPVPGKLQGQDISWFPGLDWGHSGSHAPLLSDLELNIPSSGQSYLVDEETGDDFWPGGAATSARFMVVEGVQWSHTCPDCGRGFDSREGPSAHRALHCPLAGQSDWEVEQIVDVRGAPEERFFLVRWAIAQVIAQVRTAN